MGNDGVQEFLSSDEHFEIYVILNRSHGHTCQRQGCLLLHLSSDIKLLVKKIPCYHFKFYKKTRQGEVERSRCQIRQRPV